MEGDVAGGPVGNSARRRRRLARGRAQRRDPQPERPPLQAVSDPRYEAALAARVLPELGAARLSDIRRIDLQDFADRLCADGLDASTVRNTLMPLRAIFRRALARGDVAMNPTTGLELPAVDGRRDRIASPAEAAALLAALPERDRAPWATAM